MDAADLLSKQGIDSKVIKLIDISNATAQMLMNLIGDAGCVYIIEECVSGGSLASKLALESIQCGYKGNIKAINLGNKIIPSASTEELMQMFSLDADGIADSIMVDYRK
jgi:deoxyxylulose-5-phosphate synthase